MLGITKAEKIVELNRQRFSVNDNLDIIVRMQLSAERIKLLMEASCHNFITSYPQILANPLMQAHNQEIANISSNQLELAKLRDLVEQQIEAINSKVDLKIKEIEKMSNSLDPTESIQQCMQEVSRMITNIEELSTAAEKIAIVNSQSHKSLQEIQQKIYLFIGVKKLRPSITLRQRLLNNTKIFFEIIRLIEKDYNLLQKEGVPTQEPELILPGLMETLADVTTAAKNIADKVDRLAVLTKKEGDKAATIAIDEQSVQELNGIFKELSENLAGLDLLKMRPFDKLVETKDEEQVYAQALFNVVKNKWLLLLNKQASTPFYADILEIIRFIEKPDDIFVLTLALKEIQKEMNNLFVEADKVINKKLNGSELEFKNMQMQGDDRLTKLGQMIASTEFEAQKIIVDFKQNCKNNIENARHWKKRCQDEIQLIQEQFDYVKRCLCHDVPVLYYLEQIFKGVCSEVNGNNYYPGIFEKLFLQLVEVKEKLADENLLKDVKTFITQTLDAASLTLKEHSEKIEKPYLDLVKSEQDIRDGMNLSDDVLPVSKLTRETHVYLQGTNGRLLKYNQYKKHLESVNNIVELVELEKKCFDDVNSYNDEYFKGLFNKNQENGIVYEAISKIFRRPREMYAILSELFLTPGTSKKILNEILEILINKAPLSILNSTLLEAILETIEQHDRGDNKEHKYDLNINNSPTLTVIDFVRENPAAICQYLGSHNKLIRNYNGRLSNYLHHINKGDLVNLEKKNDLKPVVDKINSLQDINDYYQRWCRANVIDNSALDSHYNPNEFMVSEEVYSLFSDFVYQRKPIPWLTQEAEVWFTAVIKRMHKLELCLREIDNQKSSYETMNRFHKNLFFARPTEKIAALNELQKQIKCNFLKKGTYKLQEITQQFDKTFSPVMDQHRLRSLIYFFNWLYHAIGKLFTHMPPNKTNGRKLIDKISEKEFTALPSVRQNI